MEGSNLLLAHIDGQSGLLRNLLRITSEQSEHVAEHFFHGKKTLKKDGIVFRFFIVNLFVLLINVSGLIVK